MKSFLEYVASDLLKKYGTNLSRTAVVFPNKRASLFLNEHLARLAGKPLWSPAYITISDLFRRFSQREVADPIKLVCDLHKCFVQCTGIDETLDHFYGWGQLLLADFDDVDKNMAPADRVFANLRDIHELDDVSYLTAEQTEIIRRFFSNFSQEHNTELKRRFLQLWSHIGDIYRLFNRRLKEQGLAYEGALYREVAELEDFTFEYDQYIIIGFNMLQQVEKTLFKRLQQQGKARFYWDFDHYYLGHEAGHYIAQHLSDFPNELDIRDEAIYDNFRRERRLTFISAPTETIQARYVSTWLNEGTRISDGRQTAIVLCSEELLQAVTHSLPETIGKVNITTGYPLAQTPVTSLISLLITLQVSGYDAQRRCFRLRYINRVLRHPYARYVSEETGRLFEELNTKKIYYPEVTQLTTDEGLTLLFTPVAADDNAALLSYLLRVLRHIATSLRKAQGPDPAEAEAEPAEALFQESMFRMYTLLNRLSDLVSDGTLHVDTNTLQRLITQQVNATSIPFHGEPAEGLQLMGVLETRNLDFSHVLLLSCNEGNLPKGVNDTSFIPYSIRKAYGLTTIDHKIAIYAYYFHRLLQRAEDITLVYNNATNDGQTGEMSRFMLQLMVESGHPITFQTLQARQQLTQHRPQAIEKTGTIRQLLTRRFHKDAGGISPTAINKYMRCPLQFYYYYVAGITEPDNEDVDITDNRTFGNIFHLAAQLVYKRLMATGPRITAHAIDELLKQQVDIERAVDDAFKSELFKIKDPSRPLPPFDGMQLINREVIIRYVRQLLEADRQLAPFTILGLERPVTMPYGDTIIGGTIDRLDSITTEDGTERIRVIDYKTGNHHLKTLADVDAIFAQENLKEHSDYYLQAFLYSHIVRLKSGDTPVSPALLFIQHAGGEGYDPTLCLDKQPVTDIAPYSQQFMQQLGDIIADIFDSSKPFTPTADRQRCRLCPYAGLCGI